MISNRAPAWIAAAICLVSLTLTGCAAVSSLLGSEQSQEAVGGALGVATDLANASGSPILLGVVGILNGIFALWAGKRAAKRLDAQDWSEDDVTTLVAALRARGFRVDK